MDAYTGFAAVYDEFMEEIPYDDVCTYLVSLLSEDGIRDGLVLELGCGTGEMTLRLSHAGYDMIGVDASDEMLMEAREKLAGEDILYLLQDMREFELYGTIRAVVAVTDTMNYLTDRADFVQVLKLVNNYLDPEGLFLFDLKTKHFYEDVLADATFADHREDADLIWENSYDPESCLNEYAITIFSKCRDGRYEREEEFHYQRAYLLEEVKAMAEEAGLVWVKAYRAYTKEAATEEDERFYIILREKGKTKA